MSVLMRNELELAEADPEVGTLPPVRDPHEG